MQGKCIVVTGGAKSGKSVFAETYIQQCAGQKVYVATAQALDEEMKERIAVHKKRRPSSWQTIEMPYGMPNNIQRILQHADVVLVDCLTMYFSNFLFAHEQEADAVIIQKALQEMEQTCQYIHNSPGKTVVFVTNEIGCGIVPMGRVSRLYRDLIGAINQKAAAEAEQVYATICGITIELKSRQVHLGGEV